MAATNASKAAAAKKDVVADAKEIVEDVQELVEDSVELVKKSWLARNPRTVVISAAILGIAAGAVGGYFLTNHFLRKKYQSQADAQVEDVKSHYAILYKENTSLEELAAPYANEQKVADRLEAADIIAENGYTAYNKIAPVEEEDAVVIQTTVTEAIVEATTPTERNIFESLDPDTYFDFDEELRRREEKPDSPFVITKDEFDDNETDYDQSVLTYYDGDDVLADSQDTPIDDVDGVIGVENLLRFGHGSGDPKIVYIRNNKLTLDFEIVHSEGKFSKEVLGYDEPLQHSATRPRKMRLSDE